MIEIISNTHKGVIEIVNSGIPKLSLLEIIKNIFLWIILALVESNLLGLMGYIYGITVQIWTTIILSLGVFITSIFYAIRLHGIYCLEFFLPGGTPKGLMFLLILIEFVSFTSRIVSLSVRLSANILAGHIFLYLISQSYVLINSYYIISPSLLILGFTGLEHIVALLQVYILIVISFSYFKDSINLH